MGYSFSDRTLGLRPSAIREIIKNMSDPTMISFAGGNPAVDCFPIDDIRTYSEKVLAEKPIAALQYSTTEGVASLRESVLAFVNRYSRVSADTDDVAIVSGSQQAMNVISRIFCNDGDVVLAEDPSFVGALNAFRQYSVTTVGVPVQQDGVDLEKLEAAFAASPKPKFFYVIPNFQNPTGLVTSLEKRKAIYDLAERYNVLVVEDNPYGELRFRGEYIPPIKSFDKKGLVLYCGSFSKIMAPGMRLAYIIANREIIEKVVTAKQCDDTHTNLWSQLVCDEWLRNADTEKHIEFIRSVYERKCDLMLAEMDRCFNKKITYTRPSGGMFLWATLPDGVDMMAFVKEAQRRKVAVVPGNAFLCDQDGMTQCFRLNYSTPSEEDIVKGIGILGELTDEFCNA